MNENFTSHVLDYIQQCFFAFCCFILEDSPLCLNNEVKFTTLGKTNTALFLLLLLCVTLFSVEYDIDKAMMQLLWSYFVRLCNIFMMLSSNWYDHRGCPILLFSRWYHRLICHRSVTFSLGVHSKKVSLMGSIWSKTWPPLVQLSIC